MSIETKAALLGLAAGLAVLGGTFGLSPFLQRATAAAAKEQSTNIASAATSPTLEGEARRGHSLFDHNCAHCHGDDARGDEGPSLYDLNKPMPELRESLGKASKVKCPSSAQN